MDKLIVELVKIQKSLKAPKNQYNKFGGYKYRNCEDILEAVKPLLPNNMTVFLSDTIVTKGIESNLRYYVEATATFTDGTNKITTTAYARESETRKGMDESQITGSASSYARKYALNGLFDIDDTQDADSRDNSKSPSELQSEQDRIKLEEHVESTNTLEDLKKLYIKHKGAGKWFDAMVNKRKAELTKLENGNS